MAQSLTEISLEQFQFQLSMMNISNLKHVIENIYKWKMDNKNKLDPENIHDMNIIMNIERKETKVWNELQLRGYLGKNDYEDFYNWLSTMNKKKVVF